ncbi:MAG: DUF1822 family protein [Cyanobacteria bacterium SBLK]|nr:DUF1822 family protein [Cyanobacteria bacterium SBLK]
MKPLDFKLPFTVPLTLRDRQIAFSFSQKHSNGKKAQRVYLNTLAILASRVYFETFGMTTDLDASESWDPLMQAFSESADLEIIGRGKIECRPVLPDTETLFIPAETWESRSGYVAVGLNAELNEARLLGFLPPLTFASEEIPLERLEPLANLLDRFATQSTRQTVHLSRWFDRTIEAGWETLETLFGSQQFAFRNTLPPDARTIKRGKRLEFETVGEQIALLVDIVQKQGEAMDIATTVMPFGETRSLPKNLQLILLDETGESILHAKPGSHHSNGIELQFSGEIGESFRIEIILLDCKLTEEFTI